MSKIEVNTVEPQCGTTLTVGESGGSVRTGSNNLQASDGGNLISQSGTTITLGASGDTITKVPVTVIVPGTVIGPARTPFSTVCVPSIVPA